MQDRALPTARAHPGATPRNLVDSATTATDTALATLPSRDRWPGEMARLHRRPSSRRHSSVPVPGWTGRQSPRERRGGRQRDDPRPVRLRSSGGPGRSAADPQGSGGRGEAPVRRLQPDPAHQAPPGAAGPPRGPQGHHRARRDRRDRRRARIGARATHRQIHEHAIIVDRYPMLDEAIAASSATRRSATGARSAAPSPTRTRRATGRPSCWR